MDRLEAASLEDLLQAPEVGEKIAESVKEFFADRDNRNEIARLRKAGLNFVSDAKEPQVLSDALAGKSFVISGTFEKYERDELKDIIIANGGKVLSGVSGKLDYLLGGEGTGPSKTEKAKALGVKIISEQEFENMLSQKAKS
jgi:DNA ligase (NAD+)